MTKPAESPFALTAVPSQNESWCQRDSEGVAPAARHSEARHSEVWHPDPNQLELSLGSNAPTSTASVHRIRSASASFARSSRDNAARTLLDAAWTRARLRMSRQSRKASDTRSV